MDELSGKVALITGGASGIGLGIAHACVGAGMKVVIADYDERTLEPAASQLRQSGASEVMAFRLDVRDRAGWARAADEVPAALGPVQLLVNNAGVSTLGAKFDEVTPQMWDQVIAINLTGVFNGVLAFFAGMRAIGSGHIVNTSSVSGLVVDPKHPYCASKFGVVGFSEALRDEFAEYGIGVSVLCPGGVRTQLWRTSRPLRGLPDTDIPPDDPTAQSATAKVLPEEVGRRVLDGVIANHLYILTPHPGLREALNDRHERLLNGVDRAATFAYRDAWS